MHERKRAPLAPHPKQAAMANPLSALSSKTLSTFVCSIGKTHRSMRARTEPYDEGETMPHSPLPLSPSFILSPHPPRNSLRKSCPSARTGVGSNVMTSPSGKSNSSLPVTAAAAAVAAAKAETPLPPVPPSKASPPKPLLSRWEEVFLADTLHISLDPVVARAKRVLHMAGLEEELREEEGQEGWCVIIGFKKREINPSFQVSC